MELLKRSLILALALSFGAALAGCETGADRSNRGATGSTSGTSSEKAKSPDSSGAGTSGPRSTDGTRSY